MVYLSFSFDNPIRYADADGHEAGPGEDDKKKAVEDKKASEARKVEETQRLDQVFLEKLKRYDTSLARRPVTTPGSLLKTGAAITGVLVGDDLTGIGVADDVAIPPVIVTFGLAAVGLSIYNAATDRVDEEDGYMALYRGVATDHPGYGDALQGMAIPRGGNKSPSDHNRGFTKSKYTSWSTSPTMANRFATKSGVGGVVLVKRFTVSEMTPSPDRHNEGEILIRGIVIGATPVPAVGPTTTTQ